MLIYLALEDERAESLVKSKGNNLHVTDIADILHFYNSKSRFQ